MPIIVSTDLSESSMYTGNSTSVILDGVHGKCMLAGVPVHSSQMEFPTPTSSATSSTSPEDSSDGGSTLAIEDGDKSTSSLQYNNSDAYSLDDDNINAVQSVQLPGFGKVLAVNSEKSCDLDVLYDEQKKAFDVDAFVGKQDETDDEDEYDLPVYTSKVSTTPARLFGHLDDSYDIEAANDASSACAIGSRSAGALSSFDSSSDPFAQRVGKKLTWRNVNMTLRTQNGTKKLLNNVWGEVPATETTAIMGASGAGKTSLLNVLAGRASSRGRINIEADVRLENYAVDPTNIKLRKSIAFVAQDDSLQSTATPREAIRFSAKLRLPRSMTEEQLDTLTDRMLHELSLTGCADTIVGGELIKGISGGERKRASIGVELVVKPSMVFLDEPTSGLDSFTAVQVCKVLKRVANSGASVLFTIHQPSSEMFKSFDRLILLHKGRVLFQGPCRNVPSTFASSGYPLPDNYNPADWVVHVAQSYPAHKLEAAGFYQKDKREVLVPFTPLKGQNDLGETIISRLDAMKESKDDKPPGLLTQVNMLYKRELAFMYRFPQPLYARFGFTAILSSLIGMIFWNVGQASYADPFNVMGQFGTVMILLMLAMLGTAQPALLLFPEERPIFLREYSTDHYSVMSYFISRLVVEMIITGIQVVIMTILIYFMVNFNGSFWVYLGTTYGLAMSSTAMAVTLGVLAEGDAKVAQQLLPIMFIPQLLSSGFFVSPNLMPTFLQWAQYVSVLAYAVKILIVEEFHNCSDNMTELNNCQDLLDSVRANPNQVPFYTIMLVIYFFIFRALALYLLRKSAMRFY